MVCRAEITNCRPDGRKYSGGWLNGKQSGTGAYTNNRGDTVTAEWKDGKKISSQSNPTNNKGKKAAGKKA